MNGINRDPFGAWTRKKCVFWALLLVALGVLDQGELFQSFRIRQLRLIDFFQEWASARNWRAGEPVYRDQRETLPLYLGVTVDPNNQLVIRYNAHPPSSVLLGLPLCGLSLAEAFLVWNLLSLLALAASIWLLVRELQLVFSPWALLPLGCLLFMCNPLRQQINQGQLNGLLLLLLTATWVAERNERYAWAGVFLAVATAFKLFPGFLFFLFALRRRWSLLLAGTLTLGAITALTLLILGWEPYRDYVQLVMPQMTRYRDWWLNASAFGFWAKLLDGSSGHVEPLSYRSPAFWLFAVLTVALLLRVLYVVQWYEETREDRDLTYALAIPAMLLMCPLTWDHSLLLMLLPLTLWWVRLPSEGPLRVTFIFLAAMLCLNPKYLWDALIGAEDRGVVAAPWQTVLLLSLWFYVLVGLFILGVRMALLEKVRRALEPVLPPPQE